MWKLEANGPDFSYNNTTNKGLSIVVRKYSYHRHIAFLCSVRVTLLFET